MNFSTYVITVFICLAGYYIYIILTSKNGHKKLEEKGSQFINQSITFDPPIIVKIEDVTYTSISPEPTLPPDDIVPLSVLPPSPLSQSSMNKEEINASFFYNKNTINQGKDIFSSIKLI